MRRGGGVPAALLLSISWLVQALVVGACFDIFQCFDRDYPKCNYTAAGDRVNGWRVARNNVDEVIMLCTFSLDSFNRRARELHC